MSTASGPRLVTDGLVFLFDAGNHKSYPGSGTTSTQLVSDKAEGAMTNITVSNGHFNYNGASSQHIFPADSARTDIYDGGGTSMFALRIESDGENSFGFVCSTVNGASGTEGWAVFTRDESGSNVDVELFHQRATTDGRWIVTVNLNTWYILTITYDDDSTANDPIFYVNGVSASVTETATPNGAVVSDSGVPFGIGNRAADTGRSFDGDIDYVALYNRTLSADEVLQNFNALRGRFDV